MVMADNLRPKGLPPFCRLKETPVAAAGRTLSILSVSNVDDLVDQARGVEELPFWAELWPSALVLSEYLTRADLHGLLCLELGAGVGLVGLAARCAGADVVQSDYVPLALEFCQINAQKNGVVGVEYLLADWRNFPACRQFDIICGSDILYEPLLHDALETVFLTSLKPNGRVILADPLRPHADSFSIRMRRKGWIESVDLAACQPLSLQPPVTVAIYEYTKSADLSA